MLQEIIGTIMDLLKTLRWLLIHIMRKKNHSNVLIRELNVDARVEFIFVSLIALTKVKRLTALTDYSNSVKVLNWTNMEKV